MKDGYERDKETPEDKKFRRSILQKEKENARERKCKEYEGGDLFQTFGDKILKFGTRYGAASSRTALGNVIITA